jgi:hypothetical protein
MITKSPPLDQIKSDLLQTLRSSVLHALEVRFGLPLAELQKAIESVQDAYLLVYLHETAIICSIYPEFVFHLLRNVDLDKKTRSAIVIGTI